MKKSSRDGVYEKNGAYWISWTDASGQRKRKRTYAATKAHARGLREERLNRAERAEVLGFTPPSDESFAEVAERFLQYQHARLTAAGYGREKGIVKRHLIPAFPISIAELRRGNIQR